jgi:hypothetical protein
VEVLFTAVPGGTRLDLVHLGWERLGERARTLRNGYDTGWDFVLGKFVEQAGM